MLDAVLPILHSHRPGNEWWSFGGGTALAIHLDHRVSYDIDIFLESSRDLKALTPNQNPLMKALLGADKYEYPGNYLKISQPGGEIDFITALPQTDPGTVEWRHGGYPVRLETPVEIAMKKLFYRPSTFKIRDIFDVAAVIDGGYRESLLAALPAVGDRLAKVLDRIAVLEPVYEQRAVGDVDPTVKGRKWLRTEKAIPPVLDLLREAQRLS
jgi:hypothetical protein